MTLIAAFSTQNCPVLFGDLLLTGEATQNDKRTIAVPALGDVGDFFGDSDWAITGLAQKVVLISPSCAIAWAGSWIGARSLIFDLREMSQLEALTADSILSYLEQNTDLQQHPVSVVGWVLEGSENFKQFWYGAEYTFTGDKLGLVAVAGTGRSAMKQFVETIRSMPPIATTGNVGPAQLAIGTTSFLTSALIRTELHGGNSTPTLLSMFGGGYETAIYTDGAFRKIGDITYVLWEACVIEGKVTFSSPQLILKQQYFEEILLLRSVRTADNNGNLVVVDQQFHTISPMYPVSTELNANIHEEVSLQSSRFCHMFFVHSGSDLMIFTHVAGSMPDSEPMTTIKDSDGKITLEIRGGLMEQMTAEIQRGAADWPSM